MLSTIATLVLAASVVTPQLSQTLISPQTGAPKFEVGVLSAPLNGELTSAVRAWATSQGAHYGLSPASTLTSTEAFTTRFGASFHLQQMVRGLEVYNSKLVVTLDENRQVTQVSSSLSTFKGVVDGESLTGDEAMRRAGASLPLVALRPDGVPYGGAKSFYFLVGEELHRGFVANVQSLDFSKNWYVGLDVTTGERLFAQNRVHTAALDAKVYPISPGGLDAGVGATATVTRQLVHADGGSMIGDSCVIPQADGGFPSFPNDGGELCGDQLMMYNCCPTSNCQADAGPTRVTGALNFMGIPVQYSVPMCNRVRRASNLTNGTGDFVYTPNDPPMNRTAVLATDLANSDEFAEVHSFYHVNTVYDWMRRLSARGPSIFAGNPNITPFMMRDERRNPSVKPAVWANVMFPNFNEIMAAVPGCLAAPPCRAETLLRLDNAAFFPRENFAQLPLPGFDTGADTLMIFQGNAADAAYDATVIQHEFGHGAVYATAAIAFDDTAIDSRSANNEGGALHEGFADYIAAAFNNVADLGVYFGPRVTAGQPMTPGVRSDRYLRTMDNTFACPDVLWGEVHQDSMHVAGALWTGRQAFLGTDAGDTYDAAFYAMLVSITPNADFAMVAGAMAARVATAFPAVATASAQMTTIFMTRGVTGCSKVLTVAAGVLPRQYYGIPAAPAALGMAVMPGPIQFKIRAPTGALRVRVTASVGGGGGPFGMGQPPEIRLLARNNTPITFVRQGGGLVNDADVMVTTAVAGSNLTGVASVNALCNTDVFVTLAAPGGGATLQDVNFTIDPLVNCMLPVDAGTGGGGGADGGAGGGGGSGGNTGTTTFPSVGPGSTTEQANAKVGCGCTSPTDFGGAMLGLMLLLSSRRRRN